MSGRRRTPKVAVMETMCPACGRRADAGDRFCAACGASLQAAPARGHEERKTVSVVFADLVGYTAQAERLDPEESRRLLAGYWEAAREELERKGGTVEKFIGDAVVGLFGAPTAHEDDAERAVRAALAIRERATRDEGPSLRIAVATGTALVRVDAHVEHGEAMVVGDVVNAGARLQAEAPVGGVLVDEATYLATRDAVRFRARPPVAVKGKRGALAVWEALGVHGPPGRHPRLGTQFAGRELELALLRSTLDRVLRDRAVQLVTVIGAPGIGKSRLVEELAARDPQVAWWQGRSLPYGDGLTFWAFAEAVKTEAGITDADGRGAVETKLELLLDALVADRAERAWIGHHARLLVGVAEEEPSGDDRLESFSAWRRLLEAAAERGPLVLVLEDLQWADDGLLDLVEHLVEWAAPVPLLVLATARPELLERRPAWSGGKPNALTLTLGPLSDEETRLVLADVLPGRAGAQADAVVARAGGNPLYVEQFARMLLEDAGALGRVPDSVQGIVAARLDRVGLRDKSLLLDASVVGASFTCDAAAAVAGVDAHDLEAPLHRLERKQLVVRAGGKGEYAFAHRLVRDVAYEQIPRTSRAEKHLRLARWIEARDRLGEEAELVAHHYARAREYRLAAGLDAATLDGPTCAALVRAGERALALNAFAAATRLHAAALELWPAGLPGRARVLLRHAQSAWSSQSAGEELAVQARDGLLAESDADGAAEAEVLLSEMWWYRGDRVAAGEHLQAAVDLVRDAPPSRAKTLVVARLARSRMLAAAYEDAICFGREALALATELGLADLQAEALNTIGSARFRDGDPDGAADVERAIALAPNSRAAVVAWNNLASLRLEAGDRERGAACVREGRRLAERLGDRLHLDWFAVAEVDERFLCGDWATALAEIGRLIASLGPSHYLVPALRTTRATILHARGDPAVPGEAAAAVEGARAAGDPQVLVPTLGAFAFIALREGRPEEAERMADEAVAVCDETGDAPPLAVFDLASVLVERGRAGDLLALLDRCGRPGRWLELARRHARGELDAAAVLADALDGGWGAAYLHLRAAAQGGAAARAHADAALAYYRSVGAERYVSEAEALRAAAGRRSRSSPTRSRGSDGSRGRADASASRTSGGAAPRRRRRPRGAQPPPGGGHAPSP